MKACIMFDTLKDLGVFMAKPQDLAYLSDAFELAGSSCIEVDINGLTSLEAIKARAVNGVVIPRQQTK